MTETNPTLLVHCGGMKVSRERLKLVPKPESLGPRHQPVPHHDLIETLIGVLEEQSLHVVRDEYAIYGQRGARLFATLDVRSSNGLGAWSRDGQGFALGLRGANDKSLSLQIACGTRVFVCDNMVFSGDLIALRRKHTTGLRLEAELRDAIQRYREQTVSLVEQTDRARSIELRPERAKEILFEEFRDGTLPPSKLPKVADWYFDPPPEATDVSEYPGTLYSLTQAMTREARDLKPARKFQATTRIGRLLAGV